MSPCGHGDSGPRARLSVELLFDNIGGVGSNSHDRDLRLARAAYLGAVRRFDAALRQFDASDIPMDPRPGPQPRPWTAEHVAIMREPVLS